MNDLEKGDIEIKKMVNLGRRNPEDDNFLKVVSTRVLGLL